MGAPKFPELGCPPGTFSVGPSSSAANPGPGPANAYSPGGDFSEGIPPGRLEQILQRVPHLRQVFLAGGSLASQITHPTFTPFEQLYRRLPEQGVHSTLVTPERPLAILMGGFRVPARQTVLIFDFRPDVYRFSGVDPNDFVPFENRRFSGQMGWDVAVDNQRPANLRFELQPIVPQTEVQTELRQGQFAPNAAFAAARANAFAATAGPGTALLPQRPRPYGPRRLPLTLIVPSGSQFIAKAIFFRFIRGNLIHDIVPNRFHSRPVGPFTAAGIYLDGNNRGCRYEGNVAYRAAAVHFFCGNRPQDNNNTWIDNVFLDQGAPPQEFIDAMQGYAGLEPAYRRALLGPESRVSDHYALTERSVKSDVWSGCQFHRMQTGDGAAQVIRRVQAKDDSARFKLRGLDVAASYELKLATSSPIARTFLAAPPQPAESALAEGKTRMNGQQLMEQGIGVKAQPAQIVWIAYRRVQSP